MFDVQNWIIDIFVMYLNIPLALRSDKCILFTVVWTSIQINILKNNNFQALR